MVEYDEIYMGFHSNHDFLFYSTRDYNKYSSMEKIISNYALNYALNQDIEEINRIISRTEPYYFEDFKKIKRYSTPAYFWSDFKNNLKLLNPKIKQINPIFINFTADFFFNKYLIYNDGVNSVVFQYNAIGEEISFKMEKATHNFPNEGKYEKISPLSLFISFIFGSMPPNSLIRLGKKLIPIRSKYIKIKDVKIKSGNFYPSHPVNLTEIRETHEVISGSIIYMRPAPMIIDCQLKGEYCEILLNGIKMNVIPPNNKIYQNIH